MITTLSLTNDTLTVIIDNGAKIVPVRSDNPKWAEIIEVVKQFTFSPSGQLSGPEDKLLALLSLKAVVETYSVGQLSVNSTGVTYRGQPMHGIDSARVMAFLREGLPYQPIANYMARKMANPSARAISELYSFLEHQNMPITPEGKIIAYKGVHTSLYSVNGNTATVVLQGTVDEGGHILNAIGATIEVERSSVDDNFNNGCSFGLHAGSLAYATGWGSRCILVEIDPADVVSVPADCSCQKLRCCKYKVVGEYTGALPNTYTAEFSSADSGDDGQDNGEADECPTCGLDTCDGNCDTPNDSSNTCPTCGTEGCWDCASPVGPPDAAEVAVTQMEDAKAAVAIKVREIVGELLLKSAEELRDSRPFSELEVDGLDEVEIALALEDEFQVTVNDETMETILRTKNVSDLIEYIYTLLTPAAPVPTVAPAGNEAPALDEAFVQGKQDGIGDYLKDVAPKYLAGDELGADSDRHAAYIKGYIEGFTE